MDGHALSAAVLAMATFAIGLSVYLRGRIQRSLQRFLILCLGVCLWHVAAAIHGYAWGPDWWRRVWGVSPLLVAVWLPSASLRFFAAFLRAERRKVPSATPVLHVLALCLTIVVVATVLLPDEQRRTWGRFLPDTVG